MIYRFMEGVDQSYQDYVEEMMKKYLKKLAYDITNLLVSPGQGRTKFKRGVVEAIDELIKQFSKKAHQFRRETFVHKVTEVLDVVPKEELASMAEGLVNLTSIKLRISMDRETVGGPVDVAVISKGDGFVWIKRKHYFDPGLNPHFATRYFLKGDRNGTSKA